MSEYLTGRDLFVFARRTNRAAFLAKAREHDMKARRREMIRVAAERRKVKAC